MISAAELERLSQTLHVYDVDQRAWEQEGNGLEANARHVLTHMAKSLVTKDFSDPDVVRDEIAPDSIQYALRFGRWANIGIADLLKKTNKEEHARSDAEESLGRRPPMGFPSFVGATGVLAAHLHDLDHRSTREAALASAHEEIRSAARLLMDSANIQAFQFDFELEEAFDARLVVLRNRFGIPDPEQP